MLDELDKGAALHPRHAIFTASFELERQSRGSVEGRGATLEETPTALNDSKDNIENLLTH